MVGWRLVSVWLAGLLLVLAASAQDSRPTSQPAPSKLDEGLDPAMPGLREVFVRMADQLLADATAWPAFCRQHASAKRRAERVRVIADLKRRADASFRKVEATVQSLQADGGVRRLRRYWLVNGFACEVTGASLNALAALPEVAFIYRKPQAVPSLALAAPGRRQGRSPGGQTPTVQAADVQAALRPILETWIKEHRARFDLSKVEVPWNLERIDVPSAWAQGATGQGVVIAVLDTGLLPALPLVQALWRNDKEQLNGKDDDGNGYIDDLFGWDFLGGHAHALQDQGSVTHGSICAGIMAARPTKTGGDKLLATGIAPEARLMVLRGMGLLSAYEYAVQQGADVLSMSYMWVSVPLGNYRGLYRLAHEHAAAAGLVAVGGAGNFGGGRRAAAAGRQICLPKDIPCVIAAAGINEFGQRPDASSRGPCTWNGVRFYDDFPPSAPLRKPDVTGCFGGFPCWTRAGRLPPIWRVVHRTGDGHALVVGPQGNSFSGPHAGAVAALMLSVNPDLPSWEVMRWMLATCKDLGEKGHDDSFGAGLLQAGAAVAAAKKAK